MLPDNIVCKLERCSLRRGNETLERSHKRCDLLIKAHARHAVVTARNNTEQLAVRGSVVGDGDGRETVLFLERKHICKRCIRREVRVRNNKTRLIVLHSCDHRSLTLNRLRAVNKGHAALLCECNSKVIVGDSLHYRRDERNIQ